MRFGKFLFVSLETIAGHDECHEYITTKVKLITLVKYLSRFVDHAPSIILN